ncbi:hypothetical protein INN71_02770 [Nocardioides sp. ChNu-153]|uniref:hypothetical protein n=1 Tax=Nocardioides sp. ChNu-153 TaxID=2779364 RepID=UPI00264E82B8|nr:hypothetical protein [Nocardioides sp. ChNu-153]MDN7120309.1 hypothetical protein [Nocardioides sp. ChNu-153]
MAVRHEKVVLTLEDRFTTRAAQAAAQTALLEREVERLNRRAGQNATASDQQGRALERLNQQLVANRNALQGVRGGLGNVNQQLPIASQNSQTLANQIDRASGRLGLLAEAAIALGPALIPIGAVAVPAVTGLAAQLGFAALAAGTAVLAFQGVGDAVTAMNEAALDPSIDNLIKVHETLDRLSPSAQDLVAQLQSMRSGLAAVRDSAAGGLFPGVIEGLQHLERLLPRLEDFVAAIGQAGGQAFADVAESLASDRWAPFLDFLQDEAPQAIHELTITLGALAHGLAELWMAFDPLNDDFSRWLLGQARAFDRWAAALDQTQGFEDFTNFIRESGPQVAETLGAIGNALVQVVEAAAPLGGPVLEVLETLADVLAGIANTNAGSRLITMAAAVVVLNRTLAGLTAIMGRFGAVAGGAAGGAGGAGGMAAFTSRVQGARTAVTGFRNDVRSMRGEYRNLGATSALVTSAMSNTTAASQRTRAAIAQTTRVVGGAAAGVAAFAVASGAVGSSMDIQNTAMLGLVGSMKGPWGAAIGASIGLLLDMQKGGDQAEKAIVRLNSAMAAADSVEGMNQALADTGAELDALMEKANKFGGLNPTGIGMGFDYIFSGFDMDDTAIGKAADALDTQRENVENLEFSLRQLGMAMNMPRETGADLTAILKAAGPAMNDLGISAEDLADAAADGRIVQFAEDLAGWDDHANAARFSIEQLGASFAHLNNQLDGRASMRDYEAALDGVTASIAEHGRTLDIDTEAGRANEAALDGVAQSALDLADTMSGMERAEFLHRARQDLIAAAEQFGLSGDAAARFADRVGLSGDLVGEAVNAARAEVDQLYAAFMALPGEVRTDLRTNGYPTSAAEVSALQRKYDLTPDQVTTILRARDEVSPIVARVRAQLATIGTNFTVRINGVLGDFFSAGGNFFRPGSLPVTAFAGGGLDLPNAHQAELTRPGAPLRIWSEPETQGEAYIPLANDWRRPRALEIFRETGRVLGVPTFADGGVVRPAPASRVVTLERPSGASGEQIDYGRLAAAVAAALMRQPPPVVRVDGPGAMAIVQAGEREWRDVGNRG